MERDNFFFGGFHDGDEQIQRQDANLNQKLFFNQRRVKVFLRNSYLFKLCVVFIKCNVRNINKVYLNIYKFAVSFEMPSKCKHIFVKFIKQIAQFCIEVSFVEFWN